MSETPINGGIVGPSFACIIANQFKDLKTGDRFYYENGPLSTSFTLGKISKKIILYMALLNEKFPKIEQLNEIKTSSMSRLLCDNTDLAQVQPNAFLLPLASLKYELFYLYFKYSLQIRRKS